MNDDQLSTLLRETFTAHEHLADPDRAIALAARSPRRTRRVAATLAAVTVAATVTVGTAYVATRGDGDRVTDPAATSGPTTSESIDEKALQAQQNEANQAAAQQLAGELLGKVPVLPGATRHDQAPVSTLAEPSVGLAGPPASTAWWTAPGNLDEAVAYFLLHPPEGLTSDSNTANINGNEGPEVDMLEYLVPGYPAHSTPTLLVEVAPTADGVVVRADAYVLSEAARLSSSFVEDASSVEITVLRGTAVVNRTTVDDPSQLGQLVEQFNSLRAYSEFAHSCPPMTGEPVFRRLVFHTRTGDLVAKESPYSCSQTLAIVRNGQRLDPSVTESFELLDALDAIAPLPD